MNFSENIINDFLEDLASKTSTPGGGAVAGLNDALSASLLLMVIRLTPDSTLNEYIEDLKEMKNKSLELMDEDAEKFSQLLKAFKLPHGTEEETKKRCKEIQIRLKGASLTPLKTMELGLKILKTTPKVVEKGNSHAISDAGIAALMALSGVKAAYYNVLINVTSIEDEKFVEDKIKKAENILKEAEKLATNMEEETKNKILE